MSHMCAGYRMRQFVVLVCGVLCCGGLFEAKAAWLENWGYRVPITIGSPTNLVDYQVKLLVDSKIGMKSDFGDVRFTQIDGTSPIYYWLDRQVDTTNAAIFWIRIPSVQATGTVVYMYYGNTNVITTSSGSNTFRVFEGFDGKRLGQSPVPGWSDPRIC